MAKLSFWRGCSAQHAWSDGAGNHLSWLGFLEANELRQKDAEWNAGSSTVGYDWVQTGTGGKG